jgi:hypothetical protein
MSTFGLSWLVYPFFAGGIVQTHFLRRGWVPLSKAEVRDQIRSHAGRWREVGIVAVIGLAIIWFSHLANKPSISTPETTVERANFLDDRAAQPGRPVRASDYSTFNVPLDRMLPAVKRVVDLERVPVPRPRPHVRESE